jgi:hypothetical protein
MVAGRVRFPPVLLKRHCATDTQTIMAIKFKTDEYNTKTFHHGPFLFMVYPYSKGEWTLSLYEYGSRRISSECEEIGYHFTMALSYRPESLNKVRDIISDFISTL